jgi:hypothetical protein
MTAIGVEQVTSRPARASAANDTPRTALSRVFDDLMLARRNSRLAGRPAPALLLGRWSILRELVDNQMRSIGA